MAKALANWRGNRVGAVQIASEPTVPSGEILRDASSSDEESGLGSSQNSSQSSEEEEIPGCCSCRWRDHDKDAYNFERVVHEEREAIRNRRSHASSFPGEPGLPFSVAFSGGGVRAAAFQSGVLWRLAKEGRLKDVEYFIAVSGGGYVAAAFASHCLEAAPPAPQESLDAWHLGVVAKTLCRMQENASYLVRDAWKDPWSFPAKDGSGMLPRICDVPLLVLVLGFTIFQFPIIFTLTFLIPFTEVVNLLFGGAARFAFCAYFVPSWYAFWSDTNMRLLLEILLGLVMVNFIVFVLWKTLPCCRLKPQDSRKQHRPRNFCFLMGQSALAALTRAIFVLAISFCTMIALTDIQIWAYDDVIEMRKSRIDHCDAYMLERRARPPHCSDYIGEIPWYEDESFAKLNGTRPTGIELETHLPPGLFRSSLTQVRHWFARPLANPTTGTSAVVVVIVALTLMLIIALILLPVYEKLFQRIAFLAGPAILFTITVACVRWRVFSPLTGQGLPGVTRVGFDWNTWHSWLKVVLIVDIVLIPVYHVFRGSMHSYYAHSLRKSYFAAGKDKSLSNLETNLYCPFLMFTGTLNDYKRPEDAIGIHEISMSCLHTGSESTGFVPAVRHQSLAKYAALTGAATDAFFLSMMDRVRYRFWLEVLNLSMGDFIAFRRRERPLVQKISQWLGVKTSYAIVHRVPATLVSMIFYVLLLYIVYIYHRRALTSEESKTVCTNISNLLRFTLLLTGIAFFSSFFGFLPFFKFLLYSPGIRQLHQAMRYYHSASRPPNLVYVTDGGVQDCTGLLQLTKRRVKRILLILAAEDPNDELQVLKTTIEIVHREKVGQFYDPKDPRRSVLEALEAYKRDPAMQYLHLAIRYGWCEEGKPETGHLFVSKNRLPPASGGRRVQPLLTEEEITKGRPPKADAGADDECSKLNGDLPVAEGAMGELYETDLASCCCDCCHVKKLNCGTRWPHVPNVNQCITPQMFNALSRLGYEVSASAISAIGKADPLAAEWEVFLDKP